MMWHGHTFGHGRGHALGHGRLHRLGLLGVRAVATALVVMAALLLLGVVSLPIDTGASQTAVAVDAPHPIVPLESVPVPKPQNLVQYVKDPTTGVALGKALFWDMQVGSDGSTACASCHFDAGADDRSKNQLNPRVGPFIKHQPNYQLTAGDFPYHRLANPDDRQSAVLSDTDEVTGSAGVLPSAFQAVVPGTAVEQTTPAGTDPVFNVGGVNVRRVTGRNTPSVINAVFNFRNFWDGRAQNEFNGVDPFGARDTGAKVAQVIKDKESLVSLTADCALVNGVAQPRGPLCLNNAALASQAVGPLPNNVELSADGRTIEDIGKKLAPLRSRGKKLLRVRPLGRQRVSPTDSVLGAYARSGQPGLNTTYAKLIEKTFQKRWWDSKKIVRVDPAGPVFAPYPKRPLAANEFPMSEYNFSLFFGLAVQMYESTLVSGKAPVDRFTAGDSTALTPEQKAGMDLFVGKAHCANCHGGPEFTNASVANVRDQPLETMTMGDGSVATYDNGFYNIGVRPTPSDPGVGGKDPFGNPLSMTLLTGTTGRVAVDGSFKAPSLRNVALTAPYFHNGGQLTLAQVVNFYNRGGDFHEANIDTLDPDIESLNLTSDEKASLVAFLNSLTDDRVRRQAAPFDHPQLFVADGAVGDTTSVATDAAGKARDDFFEVPATGKAGGAPLVPFPTPHRTDSAPPLDLQPVAVPVPVSVQIGSVALGQKADTVVTVNSTGVASLTVGKPRITGAQAADFTVTGGTCGGKVLPKGASCTITVRFKPRAAGARAAQLALDTNAIDSPLLVDLAGTGT